MTCLLEMNSIHDDDDETMCSERDTHSVSFSLSSHVDRSMCTDLIVPCIVWFSFMKHVELDGKEYTMYREEELFGVLQDK